MKHEYLMELSDHELILKLKKIKTNKIIDATIIGITLGIAVYSAVKNGFEFSTFLPLILAYVIVRNSSTNEMLQNETQKELNSRNIK